MARYELILRLDGALWLRIISKAPLIPRKAMEGQQSPKESQISILFCQVKFVAGCRGCFFDLANFAETVKKK